MSGELRRLRRPPADADRDRVAAYHREVATALTELGIAHGEDFLILPVAGLKSAEDVALGHFARDSETSRQAAIAAYPRTGKGRWRIMAHVARHGEYGRTRDELAADLRMSPNTIRPRVKELLEGGWLEVTEETRLTPGGQPAEVLAATNAAREEMRRRGEEPTDAAA